MGQLRTLGFAATPGFAALLAAVPGVTMPVFVATTAWMLVAMDVAVRYALDYTSTTRCDPRLHDRVDACARLRDRPRSASHAAGQTGTRIGV